MYTPAAYAVTEAARLNTFMRENSFAMLCAWQKDQLVASHVPLLLEEDGRHGTLLGHVAKANSLHRSGGSEVLAVFHGPHAYLSPTWYGEPGFVPTWNYVAVHAYGPLQIIEDPAETLGVMRHTVEFYEPSISGWRMDALPPEKRDGLLKAIVAFRIPITKIEGTWKLSQNHTPLRRTRVADALQHAPDQHDRAISMLMRQGLREEESRND
jgi:transcriptional regulator